MENPEAGERGLPMMSRNSMIQPNVNSIFLKNAKIKQSLAEEAA